MKKALHLQAGDSILIDGQAKRITMMHKQLEGGMIRITLDDFSRIECQWNKAFKLA